MFPRWKSFPRSGARALTRLLLVLAFALALQLRAEAAGTFVPAPSRVDMVYDSGRDTLYVTSGASVLRYHVGTNTFLTPFNFFGSNLGGLDLSPDGNTLVVADRARGASNVWVWVIDLRHNEPRKVTFPRDFGEGGTFTVAYGADGRVLITSTYEGSGWVPLRRLDPATLVWHELSSQLPMNNGELSQNSMLVASGDRSAIGFAEANISSGAFGRYNVSDGFITHKTGYDDGTSWFNYEMGANKDGTQYAIPTYGGTFICDADMVKTGTVLGTYAGPQPIGVVYHPVEDIAYFPWTTTTEVRAFDTNTFEQVAAYDFEENFQNQGNTAFQQGRMKMSRDGSLLFATVTGGVRFVRLYAPLAAEGQTVTTVENTPVELTLAGSVGNGGALSYRVVTQPAHGSLSGDGANLVYTPEANYEGPDSFTFKSVYGPAESEAATVQINVTSGNNAPWVDDNVFLMDEDGGSVDITLTGSDPEGSPVTFTVVGQPGYGTLSGEGANLVYTPPSDFHGTDSLTFTANDGEATSAVGRIEIQVSPVNDAPHVAGQSLATDEDAPVSFTLGAGDVDDDPLSFNVFAPPAHGSLSGTGANLTYTPAPNYSGPDSFGFRASDGSADSGDATVTIEVRPVNDAPTASGQSVTTDEDTPAAVTLSGSDADGDTVTWTVVNGPARGSLSGTAPNLVYTPAANVWGTDSFTFRVSDGTAASPVVTVSVSVASVNDAPKSMSQNLGTSEDRAFSFNLYGSDAEYDPLTFTVVTPPAHGTLSGTAPRLTYTPDPNYHGTDSFSYKVNDGTADSGVATMSVSIMAVNDAPVASPQTVDAAEDTSVPVTLTATDIESTQFGFEIVSYPQHGALSGTIPNLAYKAASNYNGPDSFTFRAYDGSSWSETVTVTINVAPANDAPIANWQTVGLGEDSSAAVVLSGSDVDGDAVSYAVVVAPAHGSLSGTAPNLVYTPAPNYNGPDSFTFKVNDGTADSNAATVQLNVSASNDAPTAVSQSYAVSEDTPRQTALYGYDVDNNPITYTVVTPPAHGSLSGTGANLTYTPHPNYSGPDSFTFKVNDGTVDSSVATVQLSVTASNDAPTANNQTAATNEDAARSITLTGADVDGDPLTYILVNPPTRGSLTGAAPNFTYTPGPNYSGTDSFTFMVSDGKAQSTTATVTINVAAVNDAPVAVADTATVVRNSLAVGLAVLSNDSDVDGDALTVTSVTQPPNGSVTIAPGGKSVSYTPRRNYRGNDGFTYTVGDGRGGTATASVTVTVK